MADFYEQARAPRLILALNSTPVRQTNDSVGTDKWAVEGLLKYIWQRLRETSPPGLQDSWLGQDGWRGTLPEDSSSGLTQAQQVEERWANVVTEMLMGVLYSSPGQAYMDDYKKVRQKKSWVDSGSGSLPSE